MLLLQICLVRRPAPVGRFCWSCSSCLRRAERLRAFLRHAQRQAAAAPSSLLADLRAHAEVRVDDVVEFAEVDVTPPFTVP